ncbi:hypothetical protein C0W92_15030 [Photobacterium angustum]|uniref:Uncharacterized protein n=1 Tax=Photobacterium angustum TaxID=661 RepID=A0A855SKZ8_PHOAN|nr:hypothetical protein C0W92_15030 [Photobacterium angustum]PSX10011.1 hypothetical protein C0W41_04225 [Photobacterium angustum]PSX16770.1 hypothetical protein C0W55_04480 [Photobacterium angustum]PSX24615.1 hypothetical protein C0W36_01325 [Photobacterium angustum]PSX41459.1 hypothetical protein C0W34_08790 [Photobacterium angustum]
MLNEALAQLADYNRILLTVHQKNTAIKLYQILGLKR